VHKTRGGGGGGGGEVVVCCGIAPFVFLFSFVDDLFGLIVRDFVI
jgi:hypothetical protein